MDSQEHRGKADKDWTSRGFYSKPPRGSDQSAESLDYDDYYDKMKEYVGTVNESQATPREEMNSKPSTQPRKKSDTVSVTKRDGKKSLTENLRVTWYGATRHLESNFQTFNLETWWVKSALLTRLNVILLLLLLLFGICYLIAAIWLISKHFTQTIKSPYICETHECRKASQWLTSTMNMSVDPCDNFYEFMCGNYRNESGSTKEGELLTELIVDPAFKVEFGANSILAKMLHNFLKKDVYDQSIKFYQACLDEKTRNDFGWKPFTDTVERIFGTKNFSDFESSNITMEEIGANLLARTGDAFYINMAFYTYPYIVIPRPSEKIEKLSLSGEENEILVKRVFINLLPKLGITDPKKIHDAYTGVQVFSLIKPALKEKLENLRTKGASKRLPLSPEMIADYSTAINEYLRVNESICPPLGINLDIRRMLRLFIKEDFRYEFYDMMALKYFFGFEFCFAKNDSEFDKKLFPVENPRLAFVAPWLFGLFWDFLLSMDTKNLMNEWKISKHHLTKNSLVQNIYAQADQHMELRCMLDLGRGLGYLPVMHYLNSTAKDPLDFLEAKKAEIRELYTETVKWFKQIPPSEVDPNEKRLGRQILGRDIHVDIIMPLVSGILDSRLGIDWLNFTFDHLRNSFKAVRYTVRSARHNWLASTNTEPTLKWWGSGYSAKEDIKSELFDIRRALIRSAEFNENLDEPADRDHDQWYTFLGRPQPNYLFFFLTIFDEPYTEESLFLKTSGVSLKIIRTIYSLIDDTGTGGGLRYTSLKGLLNLGNPNVNRNRTCTSPLGAFPSKNNPSLYEFMFKENFTTGEFSWGLHIFYHSLLTLKQSFQLLQQKRKSLSEELFNWNMEEAKKKQITQRLLPGKRLEKYSEEQLFFMAYVRYACRGSWKTHNDDLRKKRVKLETTILSLLMQMEEFANVWKCKNEALMNNKGKPRCVQWVPK